MLTPWGLAWPLPVREQVATELKRFAGDLHLVGHEVANAKEFPGQKLDS
jgi:hypothetical protein